MGPSRAREAEQDGDENERTRDDVTEFQAIRQRAGNKEQSGRIANGPNKFGSLKVDLRRL